MESESDKKTKADLLKATILQLFEQETFNSGRDEESLLVSRLLSQLESSEKEAHTTCSIKCPCGAKCCRSGRDIGIEEIAKQLRSIKRQNLISHCLLALTIVITGAWQISAASMLLTAKKILCNPLKGLGGLLRNSIKWKEAKHEIQEAALPPTGLLQVPGIDLPSLPLNCNEH